MPAALASPCRIKQKRRWVRRPTSGRTVYAYVNGNPIRFVDPLGLADDEFIKPGETGRPEIDNRGILAAILDRLALPVSTFFAAPVMYSNYRDMRDANVIGADKFFHCKANCEGARAAGRAATCPISTGREEFGQHIKGDPASDRRADEYANAVGRNGASSSGSCEVVCSQFMVNGL